MTKSLTDRTLSSLNWNFLNTYSKAFTTVIIGIVLARLLTPNDFGLIGMVVVFTGLADLFATLGLGKAIIKLKNITEYHIGIATTLTICSSIVIYFLFYFLAPHIADFYNEPELIPILRILAILFFLKGLNTVSYSQIMKGLDFKTITIINVLASVIYGVVSITFAIFDYGVWSLVVGKISSQLISVILSIYKYPIKISLKIKSKELKELLSFGGGVSLSSVFFYGTSNIDFLIIGKFLNPISLGLYTRAFNFVTQTMGQITTGASNVLFPAFAAVQDDKEKLGRAYFRTIGTVLYILLPILFSLVVVSDYVILGLYGDKWVGAIDSLKILLVAGAFRVTLQFSGAIAHATGNVYSEAFRQLIYFLVLAVGAYFLIDYGIEGIAIAVLLSRLWMFIALSQLALRIINSSWIDLVKAHIPALANSLSMVILNLLLVFIFEKWLPIIPNEIILLLIGLFNIPFFLGTIIFMPKSIKGDTFEWIMVKYKKMIPNQFIKFYLKFNSINSIV